MLEIVLYPDPVLLRVADPLDASEIDARLADTVEEMFRLMYSLRGVGLAAPQVGISKRFFIVNVQPDPDPDKNRLGERVFINPEILSRDGEQTREEGCLSIPQVLGKVTRPQTVTVRYTDLTGTQHEIEATGYFARAIQHENDHIDGKLFIDYLSTAEKAMAEGRLKEMRRLYDKKLGKQKKSDARRAARVRRR
ncbi:MAG: peptide deformylase [Planctomycetota bacterium]